MFARYAQIQNLKGKTNKQQQQQKGKKPMCLFVSSSQRHDLILPFCNSCGKWYVNLRGVVKDA